MRQGKRVLVVDDCRDTAESLAILVRLWGHEAQVAHDGPAALAAALRQRPDIVLLDLALPGGLSGYDVAQELRRRPGGTALLLVAVTGLGLTQDLERSRAAGFDVHLLKPVEPDALQDLLDRERVKDQANPPSSGASPPIPLGDGGMNCCWRSAPWWADGTAVSGRPGGYRGRFTPGFP
jgi:CheY-like chemotaxis protein